MTNLSDKFAEKDVKNQTPFEMSNENYGENTERYEELIKVEKLKYAKSRELYRTIEMDDAKGYRVVLVDSKNGEILHEWKYNHEFKPLFYDGERLGRENGG
ncbi:MAG: hypothetical protein WD876_00075 [Candidatus Pacearchaeota archaeon]